MLTRKQQWRRQKKSITRTSHDFLYEQGLADDTSSLHRNRSTSEPSVSLLLISNFGRLWSTTGDLQNNDNKPVKKSVSFSGSVHVLLIPTREEYNNAGLGSNMWWNSEDYSKFKDMAVSEIKNLMYLDDRIDCRTAQVLLYQTSNDNHSLIKSKLSLSGSSRYSVLGMNPSSNKYSSNDNDEELKDDSIDGPIPNNSKSSSLLGEHIDTIPLTHVRSEVDLHALLENASSSTDQTISTNDISNTQDKPGFLKINASPEKKSQYKLSSRTKTLYPDSYSLEASKLAHTHATVMPRAIHPLAYLCS